MTTSSENTLLNAMTRIRVAAEIFMDERDSAGLGWAEESVTDASVHKGRPQVAVVQFNRTQEGGYRGGPGVGADYLWWWLDSSSDDCFGMLVQAKRLDLSADRPRVDISHREGKQLGDLMRAANFFDVPAMYSTYTGGRVHRSDLACFHDSEPGSCMRCDRMAILMTTALQVYVDWEYPTKTAHQILDVGIGLEELVDPDLQSHIAWVAPDIASSTLHSFLRDRQDGPREIAKRIFAEVVRQRNASFEAALSEPALTTTARMFPDVPSDRGHYPTAYFDHVLRGLKTERPYYVTAANIGLPVPDEVTNRVDGIVIVQL